MQAAINWFEIPVINLDRAQDFYEKVLDRKLQRAEFGDGLVHAVFPHGDNATGGCLQTGPRPAANLTSGVRVYLDCSPSLGAALDRAMTAGAKVLQPRTDLPGDLGCYAVIADTEGNEVGLHALQ
ncbi:VOC family protein [Variovorax dokdonensis]|uniref:VOC family protein n=1 Tax=Variovorax dokdonensis TaxID=344883 RepID=A0ABT7NEE5_9BURK|nr:VOC family protein [Variovorax dokdonensis]MDM0046320.1 VOC family protein [Variovorax dokdonensis]